MVHSYLTALSCYNCYSEKDISIGFVRNGVTEAVTMQL